MTYAAPLRVMTSLRWSFNFGTWRPTPAEWTLALSAVQPEERLRVNRFVFRRDARAALAGRLLMRKASAETLRLPYDRVMFGRTDKGKPYLMNGWGEISDTGTVEQGISAEPRNRKAMGFGTVLGVGGDETFGGAEPANDREMFGNEKLTDDSWGNGGMARVEREDGVNLRGGGDDAGGGGVRKATWEFAFNIAHHGDFAVLAAELKCHGDNAIVANGTKVNRVSDSRGDTAIIGDVQLPNNSVQSEADKQNAADIEPHNWVTQVRQANFVSQSEVKELLVGVDVMRIERAIGSKTVAEFFDMMSRQFTRSEWAAIRGASTQHNQLAHFYRLWCLKESYVKAIGTGIGFSLDRLDFHVSSSIPPASLIDTTVTLNASPGVPDQAASSAPDVLSEDRAVAKVLRLISGPVIGDTVLRVDGCVASDWTFEECALDDTHVVCVALNGGRGNKFRAGGGGDFCGAKRNGSIGVRSECNAALDAESGRAISAIDDRSDFSLKRDILHTSGQELSDVSSMTVMLDRATGFQQSDVKFNTNFEGLRFVELSIKDLLGGCKSLAAVCKADWDEYVTKDEVPAGKIKPQ